MLATFILSYLSCFACLQLSGKISFKDLEFRLLRFYDARNDDAMRKELLIACSGNVHRVDERMKQIQQYRQIDAYSRGAETMIDIKDMFNLVGDFSAVEILVDLVSMSTVL